MMCQASHMCYVNILIISILQMRNVRLTEIQQFNQDDAIRSWGGIQLICSQTPNCTILLSYLKVLKGEQLRQFISVLCSKGVWLALTMLPSMSRKHRCKRTYSEQGSTWPKHSKGEGTPKEFRRIFLARFSSSGISEYNSGPSNKE